MTKGLEKITKPRRRRWVLTLFAVGAVTIGAFLALRPSVPSYQGKSVHQWMLESQSSALEDNPGLSAIGSNAVPYLARALAMRKTPYDRFAFVRHRWAQKVAAKLGLGLSWTMSSRAVRRSATWSLLEFEFEARPALPQLYAELIRPDAADRQMVVACITDIGLEPKSISLLVQAWPLALNEGSHVRNQFLYALGEGGTNAAALALPIAVASLDDIDQGVQHRAADTLARWGQPAPGAVPRLIRMLSSTNALLAGAAGGALGRVTNRADEALPALRRIVAGTNDDYARAVAAGALWRLGSDAEEIRLMLELLLTSKRGKGTAAIRLGEMGPAARASVPALLRASREEIGARLEMSDRAECAKAVLRIQGNSPEAIGVLEEALAFKGNSWVRESVAGDLGELGILARPLIPALRRALDDPARDVRHAAATALSRLESIGP